MSEVNESTTPAVESITRTDEGVTAEFDDGSTVVLTVTSDFTEVEFAGGPRYQQYLVDVMVPVTVRTNAQNRDEASLNAKQVVIDFAQYAIVGHITGPIEVTAITEATVSQDQPHTD